MAGPVLWLEVMHHQQDGGQDGDVHCYMQGQVWGLWGKAHSFLKPTQMCLHHPHVAIYAFGHILNSCTSMLQSQSLMSLVTLRSL